LDLQAMQLVEDFLNGVIIALWVQIHSWTRAKILPLIPLQANFYE
jgi:hypothetical protein